MNQLTFSVEDELWDWNTSKSDLHFENNLPTQPESYMEQQRLKRWAVHRWNDHRRWVYFIIRFFSGLQWPELKVLIATIQMRNYKRGYKYGSSSAVLNCVALKSTASSIVIWNIYCISRQAMPKPFV